MRIGGALSSAAGCWSASPDRAPPIPFRRHQQLALEVLASGKVGRVSDAARAGRVRDHTAESVRPVAAACRRLVQAGVPIVQANMGIVQTWDTHCGHWARLKNQLLPWLDRGLAALVDDLSAEGRLDETLVVVMGEFGRTPRNLDLAGQHAAGPRSLGGGLFRPCRRRPACAAVRSSAAPTASAAIPLRCPTAPYDVGATVYPSSASMRKPKSADATGRPMRLNQGRVMDGLFTGA